MTYAELGVKWHPETGARIITVQDGLGTKRREVTDPKEMIAALIEARFECYLTEEEKEQATRLKEEQNAMESTASWGSW